MAILTSQEHSAEWVSQAQRCMEGREARFPWRPPITRTTVPMVISRVHFRQLVTPDWAKVAGNWWVAWIALFKVNNRTVWNDWLKVEHHSSSTGQYLTLTCQIHIRLHADQNKFKIYRNKIKPIHPNSLVFKWDCSNLKVSGGCVLSNFTCGWQALCCWSVFSELRWVFLRDYLLLWSTWLSDRWPPISCSSVPFSPPAFGARSVYWCVLRMRTDSMLIFIFFPPQSMAVRLWPELGLFNSARYRP